MQLEAAQFQPRSERRLRWEAATNTQWQNFWWNGLIHFDTIFWNVNAMQRTYDLNVWWHSCNWRPLSFSLVAEEDSDERPPLTHSGRFSYEVVWFTSTLYFGIKTRCKLVQLEAALFQPRRERRLRWEAATNIQWQIFWWNGLILLYFGILDLNVWWHLCNWRLLSFSLVAKKRLRWEATANTK